MPQQPRPWLATLVTDIGTREIESYEITALAPLHMVRFHGVLAPNSALREQVVASARPYVPPQENTAPNPVQLPFFGKLFEQPDADVSRKRRLSLPFPKTRRG